MQRLPASSYVDKGGADDTGVQARRFRSAWSRAFLLVGRSRLRFNVGGDSRITEWAAGHNDEDQFLHRHVVYDDGSSRHRYGAVARQTDFFFSGGTRILRHHGTRQRFWYYSSPDILDGGMGSMAGGVV